MPERYLSVKETAVELGISPPAVVRLLKKKLLVGFQVNNIWRILDPAVELRRQLREPKLHDVAVVTRQELSVITGLSQGVLRWHAHEGNLKGTLTGKGNRGLVVHSVRQIRDFLAYHDHRRGRDKHSYSSIIVDWLKRYLDELKPNGEIIDRLVKEAVVLPEPARSQMVFKLWNLFDQVNDLLKECQKR